MSLPYRGAEWKAEHPDTLVLDKSEEERDVTASHYADYFADPDQLYFPHLDEDLGGVAPKARGPQFLPIAPSGRMWGEGGRRTAQQNTSSAECGNARPAPDLCDFAQQN